MRCLLVLILLLGCSLSTEAPPPAPSAVPVVVVESAARAAGPSFTPASASASVGDAGYEPPTLPPDFVAGAGTLRLGVMHSKEIAEDKKKVLEALIDGVGKSWPVIEVWGTVSGRDAEVRARLQMRGVHPNAAVALCDWLETRGWKPGAHECGLRD